MRISKSDVQNKSGAQNCITILHRVPGKKILDEDSRRMVGATTVTPMVRTKNVSHHRNSNLPPGCLTNWSKQRTVAAVIVNTSRLTFTPDSRAQFQKIR